MTTHWPFALLLAAAGTTAQAAGPIYRCGSSYSHTPCPGGTQLEAGDPRTAAQRAEARRMAAAERKAGQALQKDRQAAEKKQRGAPAIASLGPAPAASAPTEEEGKPAAKSKRRSKPQDEPFTAVVPGSKK